MDKKDQRTLVVTADGSHTIFDAVSGEHYHSRHGAVGESRHVFLEMGLKYFLEKNPKVSGLTVVEVGFGTGLNFLLSAEFCDSEGIKLDYHSVEAYPLPPDWIADLGYDAFISDNLWDEYLEKYSSALNRIQTLGSFVDFRIYPQKVLDFQPPQADVLYFDAFSATHQPEMWADEVLAHTTSFLKAGGVFVTYAITGNLKRTLRSLGFSVEKLPGAPGKREMLRATKLPHT